MFGIKRKGNTDVIEKSLPFELPEVMPEIEIKVKSQKEIIEEIHTAFYNEVNEILKRLISNPLDMTRTQKNTLREQH